MHQTNQLLDELNDVESLNNAELTAGQVLPKLPHGKEIRETNIMSDGLALQKASINPAERLIAEIDIDMDMSGKKIGTTIEVYGYQDNPRDVNSHDVIGRIMLFGQDVCNDSVIYEAVSEYVMEFCQE